MSKPDSHVWKVSEAPLDHSTIAPELLELLESRTFKNTHTLRKLVVYLWEHRDDEINEYAIATEALGRQPDFDSKIDATVRVQISRLRQKLREFYDGEGAHLGCQIVIPVGSHRLELIDSGAARADAPPLQYAEREPQYAPLQTVAPQFLTGGASLGAAIPLRRVQLIPVLMAAVVFLLASNIWLLWRSQAASVHAQAPATPAVPSLWRQFLDNGFRTRIILPTPVFFDYNSVIVRDTHVNDFAKLESSPDLVRMRDHFGEPSLAQYYISSSDVFGAMRLERWLDPAGTRFVLSSTEDLPEETIDQENIIVLGTSGTLNPFRRYLDRLNFQLDVHSKRVTDLHPAPGAPHFFDTTVQGPSHSITPGVIAVLPGAKSGTRIMIVMATVNTSALIAYLTSESGMAELQRAQAAHGNSRYFEAVVLSELNGTVELKSRLAEFKPYSLTLGNDFAQN